MLDGQDDAAAAPERSRPAPAAGGGAARSRGRAVATVAAGCGAEQRRTQRPVAAGAAGATAVAAHRARGQGVRRERELLRGAAATLRTAAAAGGQRWSSHSYRGGVAHEAPPRDPVSVREPLYGVVPQPSSTLSVSFSVVATDTGFMGGRATRKDVEITSTTDRGSLTQRVLVFSPNSSESPPCPAFLHHSFDDTRGEGFAAHAERPDRLRNGWPLGAVLDRGYGLIVVSQNDVVSHNEVGFGDGTVHSLFYPQGQSFPKALNEWGCISAIAWGASRALDYLQTDTEVDATRVAVLGHSKMGKAAVWTAATDERFALCVSAQSGCAGAALWRRKYGETLEKMVTRFPYWLCRNAHKFVGQEDDLPVDQHM
eukprot:COSAG06_NODE_8_length_37897_cov_42.611884_12_plen_370_part_00